VNFIKNYKIIFLGIAIGAIAGYFYYDFGGCRDGICQIASNPFYSMLHGGIIGGIVVKIFS